MTELDEYGRPEPPLAAEEVSTLLGFLEYQRATLVWKCAGLDEAGLNATRRLHGRDRQPPSDTVDWKADPDWEWHSAGEDSAEQLRALWEDAVARSRSLVAEAPAGDVPEQLAPRTWPDGRAPSLRWIIVHMIEEYARHNGHADLLRESVDGLTGE